MHRAGEFVFHVFGAIAHFERRLIAERTRDGIAAARKRGRSPGRPPLDTETVSAAQKLIVSGLSAGQAERNRESNRVPNHSRNARRTGMGRAIDEVG